MIASSWLDLVVGVDLHIELVPAPPAPPVPTPFPHPFVGTIFDPLGYIIGEITSAIVALCTGQTPAPTGPVLIHGLMATCTGDECKMLVPHIIIPPGLSFVKPPPSEATLLFGSQTVSMMGNMPVRAGEIALTCSDPVPLPTGAVVPTVPKNVLIGGPPGMNVAMAAMMLGLKGLRTKWMSTKLNALADKVFAGKFARARDFARKAICFVTGHPVNVANGMMFTDAVEFELPGPLPVRFERGYKSGWAERDSPLGHGWSHSYDQRLWLERGRVVVLDDEGRELQFDTFDFPDHAMRRGDSVYDPIDRLTLRSLGQFRWELADDFGLVREFGPVTGESAAERDRGLARLLKIRQRDGHEVQLRYDDKARLTELVDAVGRVVKFEYDAAGRIRYIWLPSPDGKGWRQHAHYLYSNDGDLIEARDAAGKPYRFEYDHHLMVRETNRNGLSFYFQWDGYDSSARCTRTWGDGGIYDHKITYDRKNFRTQVINSLGEPLVYQMTPVGLVEQVTDSRGGVTRYEHDGFGRVVAETNPLGQTTRTTYDARGNKVMVVAPGKAVTKFHYDDRNQRVGAVTPLGGEYRWTYDSYGRVAARTNPLGHGIRYVYEGKRLTGIVDAIGKLTHLEYDSHLNLSAARTPDGAVHRWRHDALGRVVEAVDPRGNIQRRTYDALGHVVEVLEPDGNTRRLQYDGEGNVVRAADRLRDVTLTYRGMNKLASRTIAGTTVRYRYDTEEQLLAVINEKGLEHTFERDALGEVRREREFDGLTRSYQRDALGRPIVTVEPGDKLVESSYDDAGNLAKVEYPDGTATAYAYDLAGNLVRADNGHIVVTFERDALGRVIRESQGDHVVASQYDHNGLRIALESSLGAKQEIHRNVMGDVERIVATHGAHAWQATFERDILGLELRRRLPGGAVSQWWRDQLGRPTQHFVGTEKTSYRGRRYTWDVDDRLKILHELGSGDIQYKHDGRGHLVSTTYPNGAIEPRNPDEVGNIFASLERLDREYGHAGQLLKRQTARGLVVYEYEAQGNLAKKIEPDRSEWAYTWTPDGHLAQVDTPDGRSIAFAYDPLGRRIEKNADGHITCWIWDGNVPLHELSERGEPPEPKLDAGNRYAVDNLSKIDAETFAQEGPHGRAKFDKLLERQPAPVRRCVLARRARAAQRPANDSGSANAPPPDQGGPPVVTWLFEPGTFAPLARLGPEGPHSIVTDHLGTPLVLTDAHGRPTWRGFQATSGAVNVQGDANLCPFRFPGQYDDPETGLYYNRFRYYDPAAGTYISRDPIGLRGGWMPYGYVDDPTGWTDPLGLAQNPGSGTSCQGDLRSPKTVKFSQNSIDSRFDDGRPLNETTSMLRSNPASAADIEPILIAKFEDLPPRLQKRLQDQGANQFDVFAVTGNRRLAAARNAGSKINSRFATQEELSSINLERRFSTTTGGRGTPRIR